jgi:hypothetical protein
MSATATAEAEAALTPELAAQGWTLLPGGKAREIGVSAFWRHNPACPPWVIREPGRKEVEVRDFRVLGPSRGHATAGSARVVTVAPVLVLPA